MCVFVCVRVPPSDFSSLFKDSANEQLPVLLFNLMDRDGSGTVDWREMLLGIGMREWGVNTALCSFQGRQGHDE